MDKIRIKKMVLIIVAAVAAAASLYFIYKNIIRKPGSQDGELTGSTAVVERKSFETTITGKGTLNPKNQYEVKSLVKGEVLKAPFEEGAQVKKGALLYKISTQEIENSISSAKLSLERAKKAYSTTAQQKSELQITSRVSGYVKKLSVKTGDTISQGTVVAEILNNDKMLIDIPFPSKETGNSLIGKGCTLYMDDNGEKLHGTVKSVNAMEEVLEGGILTKKVTIEVKNPGGLKAGDLAEGRIGKISGSQFGTFRSTVEENIVSDGTGKLVKLNIKEGEYVKEGQTVGTLSSRDLNQQLESGLMGIEESRLSLKAQEDQMDNYNIKAPISGQVIIKNTKKGDTIDPSATNAGPLATIYDMSVLTFQMDVDELDIRNISTGQTVEIKAGAYPDDIFHGKVEKVSLKSNTNNGVTSYPVTISIKEYGNLLPGMNVTGTIVTSSAKDVLAIPAEALIEENIVYIKAKESGKPKNTGHNEDPLIPVGFQKVEVKTGLNDGVNIEIKEGLEEGSEVYVPFVDPGAGQSNDFGMEEEMGSEEEY